MATTAKAWGVTDAQSPVVAFDIERRDLRPEDVAIAISHCGICHSDLHMARNDWGMSVYPMVPGHEIVGTVTAVGPAVTRFKAGDRVAVGCMVDSCLECADCRAGHEQFCGAMVLTYSGQDRQDGSITNGGYSDHVVVREEFVCRLPGTLDIAARRLCCAPALPLIRRCAASASGPGRRSRSPDWAGLAIWGSSSPPRWAPT